ncbi:MAG: hypothetical protein N2443_10555 [Blastocatellia bacterium]|nr:hypothetical protein [Blastocatellia bacterium]
MPNAHTFEAYRLLREKLGDEATAALLQYIHEVAQTHVATKEDIYKLREEMKDEIHKLREELKGDIATVREELKGDIAAVRDELKGDIAAVRTEMYQIRDELKGDIAAVHTEMYQIRDELKRDITQIREELRGELFRVKAILYVVIALVILSNPKVIDTLGRIVDFLK